MTIKHILAAEQTKTNEKNIDKLDDDDTDTFEETILKKRTTIC